MPAGMSRVQFYEQNWRKLTGVLSILFLLTLAALMSWKSATEEYYEIPRGAYGIVQGEMPRWLFFRSKHTDLVEGPAKVILRHGDSSQVELIKSEGVEIEYSLRVVKGAGQRLLDKAQSTPLVRDSKVTRALDKLVDVKPALFHGRVVLGPIESRAVKRWYKEAHGRSLGDTIGPRLTDVLRAHFEQPNDPEEKVKWEEALRVALNDSLQKELQLPVKSVSVDVRKTIDVDLEEYQSKIPSVVSIKATPAEKGMVFYSGVFLRTLPVAIVVCALIAALLFACPDVLGLLFFLP